MYYHVAAICVSITIQGIFNQYPWLYILSLFVFPNPSEF